MAFVPSAALAPSRTHVPLAAGYGAAARMSALWGRPVPTGPQGSVKWRVRRLRHGAPSRPSAAVVGPEGGVERAAASGAGDDGASRRTGGEERAESRPEAPVAGTTAVVGAAADAATSAAAADAAAATDAVTPAPSAARLRALRAELKQRGVDAFIVPSGDPHASEFSAASFARREFLSGFTGSAGTAVVTPCEALLWTDGRYFTQAAQQLDPSWTLMRAGLPETPTLRAYLADTLPDRACVGIDPLMHSIDDIRRLKEALEGSQKRIVPLPAPNPVDVVWGDNDRPPMPNRPVRLHDLQYAGVPTSQKLENLRSSMAAKSCDTLLVSGLDEVCWLLNIRGDDVPHCPVVLAYALVTLEDGVLLYVDERKLDAGVRETLQKDGVHLRDYTQIVEDVATRAAAGSKFWLDPNSTSLALSTAAGDSVVAETSPIVLAKALKNESELNGMREAHLKDGVALSSFLCWLEARVNGPDGDISEVEAAEKLETYRAAQDGFLATSFDTIAGSGPNGAIIHYSAEAKTCRMVNNREVFLLDSGGQYLDGTTDVTRTLHLGSGPSLHERECFTRVLQGHIAIETTVFPHGTTGFMIDAFARRPLWLVGLDYRHGTGHGVGACLNVHEGPHSISPRIGSNKAQLLPGMIVSNEPGYYEDGSFGIRIETLLIVVEKATPNRFAGVPFYGFERLTYVPIEKNMLVQEMLSTAEVEWLDKYHGEVWTKLSPRMREHSRERDWLWQKTRPLLSKEQRP